jgi:uncharacterized repeat protein (TIGR03806 family)
LSLQFACNGSDLVTLDDIIDGDPPAVEGITPSDNDPTVPSTNTGDAGDPAESSEGSDGPSTGTAENTSGDASPIESPPGEEKEPEAEGAVGESLADGGASVPPIEDSVDCGVSEPSEDPVDVPWSSGIDERPSAAVLTFPPTLEIAARGWTTAEAFPGLSFQNPTTLHEAQGTGKLFVTELAGRIWAFPNDPSVTEKQLVLDISSRTQGHNDAGLIGLAFHPEFNQPESLNAAYVYLYYAYNEVPVVAERVPETTPSYNRLSRFTVDLETHVIDPDSELVLIEQLDQHLWHQGGDMFFNPKDGFLYLSSGDEGGYLCTFDNCQQINKDLFGGVIRIDVDMRGGNISHPIVKQPLTGRTANYFIPNDNPFVGVSDALEEFYALGLRSPHRMSYDSEDDITFIGDVGQTATEELNVLQPGANFQWNVLEGTVAGSRPMPEQVPGIWTGPLLTFTRWDSSCIVGGYVYRGSRLPYLYGKYIFGDYVKGNIFALSYAYNGVEAAPVELEKLMQTPYWGNNGQGMISFGVDADGELYFMTMGEQAKIHRLERTDGFSNAPLLLSETGVFTDTASPDLEPSSGLVPYDVISPLWSDGAQKQRWITVPDGATVGFAETGSWSFPQGTVFVKHFDLPLDESLPSSVRRLETRVLVHGADDQYYGLTYKWNEAGTDANLLLESQREPIDVKLADGEARHLEYFYPGPNDCNICHNSGAGGVLGVRTLQLNHRMEYPDTGRAANQVFTWSQAGLLDVPLAQVAVEALGTLVSLSDAEADLETRIRSYWSGNCSMCHGSVADIRADWDAHFEVPLAEQGVINGPSQSANELNAVLVLPGDPGNSVLYLRSSTTDRGYGMPPLGRSVPDPKYVSLLAEWICSLSPGSTAAGCVAPQPAVRGAQPLPLQSLKITSGHGVAGGVSFRKPQFRRILHAFESAGDTRR